MFKKNERGKDGNKFNPFHRVLKQNLLKKKKKILEQKFNVLDQSPRPNI